MGEIIVLENSDDLTSLPVKQFLGKDLSDSCNVLPEYVNELRFKDSTYYFFDFTNGSKENLMLLVPYNKEKFTEQLMEKIEKYKSLIIEARD